MSTRRTSAHSDSDLDRLLARCAVCGVSAPQWALDTFHLRTSCRAVKKAIRGSLFVEDDIDVVPSLDRHGPSAAEVQRRWTMSDDRYRAALAHHVTADRLR